MLANLQLNYYRDKMKKLKVKLETEMRNVRVADPLIRLESVLRKWKGRDQVQFLISKLISVSEICRLVMRLGNSLSFGHKGIDSNFLNVILPSISNPLTYLINTSLEQGTYASRWKISKTFPLLKDKIVE